MARSRSGTSSARRRQAGTTPRFGTVWANAFVDLNQFLPADVDHTANSEALGIDEFGNIVGFGSDNQGTTVGYVGRARSCWGSAVVVIVVLMCSRRRAGRVPIGDRAGGLFGLGLFRARGCGERQPRGGRAVYVGLTADLLDVLRQVDGGGIDRGARGRGRAAGFGTGRSRVWRRGLR